jgi:Tol biopolymer transport system component
MVRTKVGGLLVAVAGGFVRRRLVTAVGLVTVLALAVVSCGGSDDSSGAGDVDDDAAATTTSVEDADGSLAPEDLSLDGRIVFARAGGRFGDETVFVANADGTGEQQLSELGSACCPWVSRDGSAVLFAASASGDRVTVESSALDGTGRAVRPLPTDTMNLGPGPFSPDGTQVAFEGFDSADPSLNGIYVGDIDSGEQRQITQDGGIPGDWSPDGALIVFFRGPEGDPPAPGSLFVVQPDGSGERRLTPEDVPVQCCFGYRWSPDGSRVLFADADGVLWTVSSDGSGLSELFRDTEGRYAITPTWSPDGSQVLFALDPTPNPFAHPANGLYVIDADGSGLALLIGGDDFKRTPSWVP